VIDPSIVIFDACVLYPFHPRNIVVQIAVGRLVDARRNLSKTRVSESDFTDIPMNQKAPAKSSGLGSIEQPPDIRHRPEQLHRLIGKRQKTLTLIEAAGRLILGVDDNGERRDLTTDRAEQSVGE